MNEKICLEDGRSICSECYHYYNRCVRELSDKEFLSIKNRFKRYVHMRYVRMRYNKNKFTYNMKNIPFAKYLYYNIED